VINLSLGQESPDDHPPLAISLALDTLDPEIIVVAAAGNSPDEIPVWPAAFRRVVAVAGLATDGTPARRWSKRGTWVDASAVAESVVAPFVAGTENPDPTRNIDGDLDIWVDPAPAAVWVGTSFAAPHVAGLIAAGVGEGATARQALAEVLAAGTYEPGFGRMITR
jgi:subtilisin family serine protease